VNQVLVIAGTDSSGGAGLIRDVGALAHFGVSAACAVTAVTAQSDQSVVAIQALPASLVGAQIDAALATRAIGAVKIGMLATRGVVEVVARRLPPRERLPCVLDPVLLASSGAPLLDAAGRSALIEELLPRVTLLTPNLPELAVLLAQPLAVTEQDMLRQGHALKARGSAAVLVKGGHADGDEAVDVLLYGAETYRFVAPRQRTQLRGSGCALASAIAAQLACGVDLPGACARAKQYLSALFAAL
jgi:hydroxymethylpyrimidine/phosphomethylpyrimidine kinase